MNSVCPLLFPLILGASIYKVQLLLAFPLLNDSGISSSNPFSQLSNTNATEIGDFLSIINNGTRPNCTHHGESGGHRRGGGGGRHRGHGGNNRFGGTEGNEAGGGFGRRGGMQFGGFSGGGGGQQQFGNNRMERGGPPNGFGGNVDAGVGNNFASGPGEGPNGFGFGGDSPSSNANFDFNGAPSSMDTFGEQNNGNGDYQFWGRRGIGRFGQQQQFGSSSGFGGANGGFESIQGRGFSQQGFGQ